MMRRVLGPFAFFLVLVLSPPVTGAGPQTFEQAKIHAREHVYHDRNHGSGGDLYCGCDWRWVGRSAGRMDLASCGYRIRADPVRAGRLEWEHVVPAADFGRARQCWQGGGRDSCRENDPVFNAMEADLHNLAPSVGEINHDRQNFPFSPVQASSTGYGACDFRIDFRSRTAEPRDAVKGMVARIYFYMHDRYDLPMSRQLQQRLMHWHRHYPVADWERERDRRIAARMGHHNPFVTGALHWTPGHRNSRAGLSGPRPMPAPAISGGPASTPAP
ncbi:MAG: endonuclease [Pigmentiphaga sp.]|nr:endonuclease [Pigmentiphaga sp.]